MEKEKVYAKRVLIVGGDKKARDSYARELYCNALPIIGQNHRNEICNCRGFKTEDFFHYFGYNPYNPNREMFTAWLLSHIMHNFTSSGHKKYILVLEDVQPELCLSTLEQIAITIFDVVSTGVIPLFIVTVENKEGLSPYFVNCFDQVVDLDQNRIYTPEELKLPRIPIDSGRGTRPLEYNWPSTAYRNRPFVESEVSGQKTPEAGREDKPAPIGGKDTGARLILETKESDVYWDGVKQEKLSETPYKLLYVLAKKTGEVVFYNQLNWLVQSDQEGQAKALSRHKATIEARIPPLKNYIETQKEIGYKLTLGKNEIEVIGNIGEVDTLLDLKS